MQFLPSIGLVDAIACAHMLVEQEPNISLAGWGVQSPPKADLGGLFNVLETKFAYLTSSML